MSTSKRLNIEDLKIWAETPGLITKKVKRNNIIWVEQIEFERLQKILNAESIPFRATDSNNPIILVRINPQIINFKNKAVRKGIVETFLRGVEGRILQFKNEEIFQNNKDAFLKDLEQLYNSDYKMEFKNFLAINDPKLLTKFENEYEILKNSI